jgi:hypothetical protein
MPCNDVTERIEVLFDNEDRLLSYDLRKRTCGRPVGKSSLLETVLTGMLLEDIAAMTPLKLIKRCIPQSRVDTFLALKHLFAVQAACAVISGAAPGGPGDPCAAAEITFEDGLSRFTGLIRVDVVQQNITACDLCSGCFQHH